MREVNCRIAFLNGVRNVNMKRKLNESSHLNFEEAIEMAKRLERVENMMSNSMVEVTPILNSLDETEVKPEGKEHDSRSKWHRNEEPYKKDRYNDRKSRSRSRVRFDDLRSQSSGSHNSRSMSPGNGRSRSWSRERNNYSNRGYMDIRHRIDVVDIIIKGRTIINDRMFQRDSVEIVTHVTEMDTDHVIVGLTRRIHHASRIMEILDSRIMEILDSRIMEILDSRIMEILDSRIMVILDSEVTDDHEVRLITN